MLSTDNKMEQTNNRLRKMTPTYQVIYYPKQKSHTDKIINLFYFNNFNHCVWLTSLFITLLFLIQLKF